MGGRHTVWCYRFLSFGYAVPYRPVEDLAFSVARFFEKGGTFQNYYMVSNNVSWTKFFLSTLKLFKNSHHQFSSDISWQYFGGTNFGRTAGGPLIATSYDYDAPIDEYGKILNFWQKVKRIGLIDSLHPTYLHAHISGACSYLFQPFYIRGESSHFIPSVLVVHFIIFNIKYMKMFQHK